MTVVLPQRYHARVVRAVPHGERSVLTLVQDFTRAEPGQSRGPEWNQLEPLWRLYRYDLPSSTAIELCTFSQPESLHTVHIAISETDVYLLFHTQLLRLDPTGRVVEGICRLGLPPSQNRATEVRGFAVRSGGACITVEQDEDQLSIHWIPLGDGSALGAPFPGSRGERLAYGPSGDVYALDLLDVYRFRDGDLMAERDLTAHFGDWPTSPTELLGVTGDGRVLAGSAHKLIVLSPDLTDVLGEVALGGHVQDIAVVPGTDRVLLVSVDAVQGTLRLQEARV